MNNNVAGIHVPDEMLEELKADKEKTKAGITGVEIAARIYQKSASHTVRVYISWHLAGNPRSRIC